MQSTFSPVLWRTIVHPPVQTSGLLILHADLWAFEIEHGGFWAFEIGYTPKTCSNAPTIDFVGGVGKCTTPTRRIEIWAVSARFRGIYAKRRAMHALLWAFKLRIHPPYCGLPSCPESSWQSALEAEPLGFQK